MCTEPLRNQAQCCGRCSVAACPVPNASHPGDTPSALAMRSRASTRGSMPFCSMLAMAWPASCDAIPRALRVIACACLSSPIRWPTCAHPIAEASRSALPSPKASQAAETSRQAASCSMVPMRGRRWRRSICETASLLRPAARDVPAGERPSRRRACRSRRGRR